MKGKFIKGVLLILVLFLPANLFAGQWEGTIQGFHCITTGHLCPIGFEDPMSQAEDTFVLHLEDGAWYLLPNLKRGVLARHINEQVLVIGEEASKYQSIQVNVLKVFKDGDYTTVWSQKMQKEYQELIGIGQ